MEYVYKIYIYVYMYLDDKVVALLDLYMYIMYIKFIYRCIYVP